MMRYIIYFLCLSFLACNKENTKTIISTLPNYEGSKGALLGTQIKSFEALKKIVDFKFDENKKAVQLIHRSGNRFVISLLKEGVTEKDFEKAQYGQLKDKIALAFKSPIALIFRDDVKRVFLLSRRKGKLFGESDKSFYDIAEAMMANIDRNAYKKRHSNYSRKDFTEKGFTNTFNHLTAQAIITTLFSEKLADYVADAHELARIPELITGQFSDEQKSDLDNGPVDNYVDVINNEWGQELGKALKRKYKIRRSTKWTNRLLTDYLNDIQSYGKWAFDYECKPFESNQELIQKIVYKINLVMGITEGRNSII
ncbi:MAG: hypothetical protein HKN51_01590 [Saprospiraceae bacterium]|nr:hypothetical protein [Saprospiraceae bacterium]